MLKVMRLSPHGRAAHPGALGLIAKCALQSKFEAPAWRQLGMTAPCGRTFVWRDVMKSTRYTSRAFYLASAAVLGVALVQPAQAQVQEQLPPPQEDTSATDADPAEIVITAQKREERILDIPQSVTVVGGDTLERQQATTFKDFAALVPGLSIEESNPGNSRIVLRGVNTGGVSATVGVYVDETPFGSSSGLVNGAILAGDFDTFDVARLEVLRGPQGTLYGASSLGGVVKYVTNAPQLGDLNGRARAGIEFIKGGEMGWNATGMLNAPLGSNAAIRMSGYYRKEAGWIDAIEGNADIFGEGSLGGEDINDGEIYGGRASLLFQPTDRLNVRLTAISQTIDINEQNLVEVEEDSQNPVDEGLIQTVFVPEFNKTRYRVYNGTIDYDLGFATLLSSTSYARLKQVFRLDGTPQFGPLLTIAFGGGTRPLGLQQDQLTGFKKFTQEFRLASPTNDRFEWMIGAFYTKEKGKIFQDIKAFDLADEEVATDVPATIGDVPSKYRELAGFANATLHVTDRLDLTAGGRISENKQSASQFLSGPLAGGTVVFDDVDSSESVFTYSVAPRFDINDNTAIYARVASGYRPGGPNLLPPGAPPGTPATFDSDSLTSYEAGLKTDVGRRLSLDVSAYLLKWQDIQLFTRINNVGLNANGGKATSKGIEASATWRPVRGFQLLANAAFIDAELDEDALDAGGFEGDPLPWVPKVSLGLNADYEWLAFGDTMAFVGGGIRYVGRQYADFDAAYRTAEGHQRKIDDYGVIDLRTGLEFTKFTVEAFVQNLTNSHGLTTASLPTVAVLGGPALPGGALSAGIIQPRTIGFTIGAKF